MGEQVILKATEGYPELDAYFADNGIRKVFLVCDSSLPFLAISGYFDALPERGIEVVRFSDFEPNPLYDSVAEGVELFRASGSDMILAVGGGSAMDVAKCIKLYANMDPGKNYLEQAQVPNDIKLLAVPTTAGTGSEATRYAVIYYEGEKQSVTDDSIIPSAVLMDAGVLTTLPLYQKKATMLDALCHGIESFWSVNSTEESKKYSAEAIRTIMANKDGYLANDPAANAAMLYAAHTAGKAINITQTTAGHAMCYKLTSLFKIAHGHAAALCDRALIPYMTAHFDRCIDGRGEAYLRATFDEIAQAMGAKDADDAGRVFGDLVDSLALTVPEATEEQFAELKTSVNPVRLKNHPVALDEDTIDRLYRGMLGSV